MQWKLGTWHELSYNVINTSNNKYAMDLEALDKETTWQAVQCSMVCLQELLFLFVFNLDLNQNTHEDCSTTPENASFSYTFSGGWKKAWWIMLSFVIWLVGLFSTIMYFEEFHHVVGHLFLYLSFAFRYPSSPGPQVSFLYILPCQQQIH